MPDIQDVFGPEFDLVKLGRQIYKDAAAKIAPKIDELIKKAKD